MHSALWWRDFAFDKGVVTVKKTGARVRVEPGVLAEFWSWLVYYGVVESWRVRTMARSTLRTGPSIYFAPDRPRPWYLVWPVLHAAGARIADSPEGADAVFFFDDVTQSEPPAGIGAARRINFECDSVSKSRVAEAFERVFGYSLAVDPRTHAGPMVEKSELNAAHDGRVLDGPCAPKPGKVYQRLIDTRGDDGLVTDIRCPTLNGTIPVVFFKRRLTEERFANMNREVILAETDQVLSAGEQARLAEFAAAMKLDWGSLDVLRDRKDGRIYVVDVNKTEMGPPTALPLRDKLKATRALGRAFRAYIQSDRVSNELS